MTIWARSDVAAVNVSAAHGACDRTHSPPVEQGAPAKIWALDCPLCEDHLRSSDLWAVSPADIPETHDEKLNREDFEKRGAKDKDALMALAVAKLAGVDPRELPESLTRMISGAKTHAPQTADCPNGHPNPLDQKFCGTCGVHLHDIPVVEPEPVVPPLDEPPVVPAPSLPSNTKMRGMKREELEALAGRAGLSAKGSRQEVLDRLLAYNKEHQG